MSLLAKILVALVAVSGLAVVAAPPASASGTVTVQVTGKGDVSGEGIVCQEGGGPDCTESYADHVEQDCDPDRKPPCIDITTPPVVELVAGPDRSGYQYAGFSGCDQVSGRTCTLTVEQSGTVSATFVDVQEPSVTVGAVPGRVRGSVTLSAGASDNSGSVSAVVFSLGGQPVGTDSTAPYAVEVGTANLPDGATQVRAVAYDAAGHASTPSVTGTVIDNTAPVVTVTEGPDGSVVGPGGDATWRFEATDATTGVADLECSVVTAGSTPSFGACSDTFQHQVSGLAEGAHDFQVRAVDHVGNVGTAEPHAVRVDATAPTLVVTGPGGTTHRAGTRLAWTVTAQDAVFPGVDLECVLAPVGAAASVAEPCSSATGHAVAGLAHGSWRLRVTARDGVGNGTSVERTFTVDGVAPTTRISASPRKRLTTRGSKAAARFRFAASEAGAFRCRVDGGSWKACRAATTVKARVGKHVLQVAAVDAVGNVDASPATYRWRVVRRR